MTAGLFETKEQYLSTAPLAERLRPETLDEYVGQKALTDSGKLLRRLYEEKSVRSLILWGPPGVGKTTLARILAKNANAEFIEFSAVLAGLKEVREVMNTAKNSYKYSATHTVLFVDEIHRFNKAQQDAFLPHVESGLITLIGATTENPSFEIIPALISRTRVLVLEPLSQQDLSQLIDNALYNSNKGLAYLKPDINNDAKEFIINISGGDARSLLNTLELACDLAIRNEQGKKLITLDNAKEAAQKKSWLYDKNGEQHYNLISALHKSLRGSDPDAALYWLSRMLEAGEDPIYILRRMTVFASEDIGMADPVALMLANSALESYRLLGSPEGDLALAHLAVYLATAEKSNAVYQAFNQARCDARNYGHLPVPMHLRNAPTKLMKDFGYGKDYQYAHNYKDALTDQKHLPQELENRIYYQPTDRGREKIILERLEKIRAFRKK